MRRRKSRRRKLYPRVRMTDEEAENKIRDMLKQGYPFPEIAGQLHRSITTIKDVDNKLKAETLPKIKSTSSKAYALIKEKTSLVDVAIELGIDASEATKYLEGFQKLSNLDDFMKIYKDLGPTFSIFHDFYKAYMASGITLAQAPRLIQLAFQRDKLMQERVNLINYVTELSNFVNTLLSQKVQLMDKINSEKQVLQNLNIQNHRLLKINSDLNFDLNSIKEGDLSYKIIDQIIKDAGKSFILSKAKALSLALTATIQVLKSDPTLLALFMAPFPVFQDLWLQSAFNKLASEAWDNISSQVNSTLMPLIIEKIKVLVMDSKVQKEHNLVTRSSSSFASTDAQVPTYDLGEHPCLGNTSKITFGSNMKDTVQSKSVFQIHRSKWRPIRPRMTDFYKLWMKYPMFDWVTLLFYSSF
jgi:hypothetical protein